MAAAAMSAPEKRPTTTIEHFSRSRHWPPRSTQYPTIVVVAGLAAVRYVIDRLSLALRAAGKRKCITARVRTEAPAGLSAFAARRRRAGRRRARPDPQFHEHDIFDDTVDTTSPALQVALRKRGVLVSQSSHATRRVLHRNTNPAHQKTPPSSGSRNNPSLAHHSRSAYHTTHRRLIEEHTSTGATAYGTPLLAPAAGLAAYSPGCAIAAITASSTPSSNLNCRLLDVSLITPRILQAYRRIHAVA